MLIAIDYDGTISADIETFKEVIRVFQLFGHEVICVTYRSNEAGRDNSDMDWLKDFIDNIYFTDRVAKKKHLSEDCHLIPDIWIEDYPENILFDLEDLPG